MVSREPYILALPAGHALAGASPLPLAALNGQPLIAPPRAGLPALAQALEAAFAAALQAEPGLFQEAFEKHVVIVSPTTLLATLQVVDSLWRQERQSQNARDIAERAGQLYDKFVAFVGDLDEVGSRLEQLDKAYAAARNKLVDGRGNLVVRVEKLKLLGARASKSLPTELLEQSAGLPLLDDE